MRKGIFLSEPVGETGGHRQFYPTLFRGENENCISWRPETALTHVAATGIAEDKSRLIGSRSLAFLLIQAIISMLRQLAHRKVGAESIEKRARRSISRRVQTSIQRLLSLANMR